MATAGSSRASGAVAGDGLPELSGSAPGMIAGRETTPPECEEAVSDSGCCQNWCRGRESNPHGRYAQRCLRPSRLPFRHLGIWYILNGNLHLGRRFRQPN